MLSQFNTICVTLLLVVKTFAQNTFDSQVPVVRRQVCQCPQTTQAQVTAVVPVVHQTVIPFSFTSNGQTYSTTITQQSTSQSLTLATQRPDGQLQAISPLIITYGSVVKPGSGLGIQVTVVVTLNIQSQTITTTLAVAIQSTTTLTTSVVTNGGAAINAGQRSTTQGLLTTPIFTNTTSGGAAFVGATQTSTISTPMSILVSSTTATAVSQASPSTSSPVISSQTLVPSTTSTPLSSSTPVSVTSPTFLKSSSLITTSTFTSSTLISAVSPSSSEPSSSITASSSTSIFSSSSSDLVVVQSSSTSSTIISAQPTSSAIISSVVSSVSSSTSSTSSSARSCTTPFKIGATQMSATTTTFLGFLKPALTSSTVDAFYNPAQGLVPATDPSATLFTLDLLNNINFVTDSTIQASADNNTPSGAFYFATQQQRTARNPRGYAPTTVTCTRDPTTNKISCTRPAVNDTNLFRCGGFWYLGTTPPNSQCTRITLTAQDVVICS